jgi:acetylornithine deacetylase
MRLLVNQGGIPTVLFGPGDVREAHRPDESILAEDLDRAAAIFAVAALRFCGVAMGPGSAGSGSQLPIP